MTWLILGVILLTVLGVVIALNFTTPEKRLVHRLAHIYGLSDPQFRREMGVLLGPTILPGNSVKDLQNGSEIFPAMLEAIASARKNILFETYIYWSGEIGERFASALAERARAGVNVHVIVDWLGGLKMEERLLDMIREAGGIVHKYRPLRWYNLARINNRTHRKLLIVDGRVAFTGGVGIGDKWAGDAQDPEHWRDMHFCVKGPVVSQFQAAFNDNWIKITGEVLHGEDYFPGQQHSGDMDAQLFISSPAGGSESMHLMYLLAIAAAERSIDLQAAYFVPDKLILRALMNAEKRGVQVRIILPGKYIDSDAVRLSSRASWGDLLLSGVEIYEYEPTMMHNKLLIVDQSMVSVGSTNFDSRSFELNDEASLNVYDCGFARRMTQVFNEDIGRCVRYSYEMWSRRSWKEKFAERIIRPLRSQL